jgi:hypothetical protein
VTIRAAIEVVNSEAAAVAQAFAAGLQAGHDQRDAETLNRQFARTSSGAVRTALWWRVTSAYIRSTSVSNSSR